MTATGEDPLEKIDLDRFVDLSGGRNACLKRVDHPGSEIDGNPAKGSRVSCSSPTYILQQLSIAGRHGPTCGRGNIYYPFISQELVPIIPCFDATRLQLQPKIRASTLHVRRELYNLEHDTLSRCPFAFANPQPYGTGEGALHHQASWRGRDFFQWRRGYQAFRVLAGERRTNTALCDAEPLLPITLKYVQ